MSTSLFPLLLATADTETTDWVPARLQDLSVDILQALITLVIGLIALRVLLRLVDRSFRDRVTAQQFMIISKAIFWAGWLIIILTMIQNLGLRIGTVLGAAGILGVAIGFAAQTSASNLISGIFLIFERPFKVGDVVQIGDTVGAVASIDLLSVKLRKFDNAFVRIPNEMIIKQQVSNITNFPLRRADINVGIAYKEDLERVRQVLLQVADDHPKALADPAPVVVYTGFGDSSQNILFGVWTMKEDFLEVRNGLTYRIKQAFDREGIEIPFPHVSVYAGEVSKPIAVALGRANSALPSGGGDEKAT